jgi:hypothetical protein
MSPSGSTWWCELCMVEVRLVHVPTRWRCRLCRKWMVRKR